MKKNELRKLITNEINRNAVHARRCKEMLDNGEGDVIAIGKLHQYYMGKVCAYMNVFNVIDLENISSVDVLLEDLHNIRKSILLCSNE